MAVLIFASSDDEYLAWLERHPNGFVMNTERQISPDYMVLHRTRCPYISRYLGRASAGGFTERDYVKACSESAADLRDWARARGGEPSVECVGCKP